MMKLELSASNLDISFECKDDNEDHLELFEMIYTLIHTLDKHENVNLHIVSKSNLYVD